MNAITPISVGNFEQDRDETYAKLQLAVDYLHAAMIHLRLDDDAATLWDISHARQQFIGAIRAFDPMRLAMRDRNAEGRR